MDLTSGCGGVLSREDLLFRIETEYQPLVTDWYDLTAQLQPNGFDLTLRDISAISGSGTIGVENADRILPDLVELTWPADEMVQLSPGAYHLLFNEVLRLPANVMALARPRSSLCRAGVAVHTAVWDAGYHGRSTSLLVVSNPAGIRLQRNARLVQLVFFQLSRPTGAGYSGVYQGENLA
ncbi:MAG: deoxyuridine 5'-triphosphate nucleotidohydrolase [Chloroflexota bacterium]|nr:deoxyuridine 5'-triphosphate nucleotidohydrolase [Chloroflexota bacterium]